MGATSGGTAIGTVEYQRRPEVASLPVRLAPRPGFLAGRGGTAGRAGRPAVARAGAAGSAGGGVVRAWGARARPAWRLIAHRHLGEVGVCWQFPVEDPAVLAAEFGVLAALLGAREVVDPRDPVASVHAVLSARSAGRMAGGVR